MAAVAEPPAELRTETDLPNSGFTAVNGHGRSPPTSAHGPDSSIPGDTIKVARSPYASPATVHKKPPATPSSKPSASAKSRPVAAESRSPQESSTHVERPVAPATPPAETPSATSAAAPAPTTTALHPTAAHSPPPASESESDSQASHTSTGKRKRDDLAAPSESPSTTSPQSHKRIMSDAPELRALEPQSIADHRRTTSEQSHADGRYSTNMDWSYDASRRMDDSQLAEALQRENMSHTSDDPETPRYGQLGPGLPTDGVVQVTPTTSLASASKQRKRNFSNRTKTGCLTCRRRKKKCDERKPKCHNCERGGFDCAGYAKTNPYPKQPSNPKGPLPLQAKDRFGEPILQGLPPPGAVRPTTHPYYPNPSQNVYVPHDQVESQPARPPTYPDDRNHRIMPMPQEPSPPNAHPHGPPPAPWPTEHIRRPSYAGPEPVLRSDFPHRGPPAPYGPDTHKNPLSPQRQLPHPPLPAAPRTNSNPHLFSSNHRVTAQLALDHTVNKSPPQTIPHMAPLPPQQAPQPPPPPPQRTSPQEPHYRNEKEKMLHGVAYNDKDSQLVKEREDCKSALFKFNRDAVDPLVSDSQLRATFKQLIEPDRLKSSGQHPNPPPIGRVGSNVTVAPHFFCQYGYNILIGDEVEIRNNCTILDSARVSIGARTTIGPNVCFYTEDLDLKGSSRLPNGKWKSITRPITIEEEVYIGGGSIIMPGVTIGRGAVVAAGSVVRQTIRPMTLGCNDIKQLAPKSYWAHHSRR